MGGVSLWCRVRMQTYGPSVQCRVCGVVCMTAHGVQVATKWSVSLNLAGKVVSFAVEYHTDSAWRYRLVGCNALTTLRFHRCAMDDAFKDRNVLPVSTWDHSKDSLGHDGFANA